jgi:hypothetical protein
MLKKCRECNIRKSISVFPRARNSFNKVVYLAVCKVCKAAKVKAKRESDKLEKCISVYDPLEQSANAFEDDPRALQEVEYGKVYKHSTNLFSRSILDDFG